MSKDIIHSMSGRLMEVIVASIATAVIALGGWVFSQSKQMAVMDEKVSRHEQAMPDVSMLITAVESLRQEQRNAINHLRETIDLKTANLELLIENKVK